MQLKAAVETDQDAAAKRNRDEVCRKYDATETRR